MPYDVDRVPTPRKASLMEPREKEIKKTNRLMEPFKSKHKEIFVDFMYHNVLVVPQF